MNNNLLQAEELAKRYRSITLEQIIETKKQLYSLDYNYHKVANHLTGYGYAFTCTLCTAVKICAKCIYYITTQFSCSDDNNSNTYYAISHATTAEELLKAFHNRADHLEILIKQYKKSKK